jgi:hypothetical protein
MKTWLYQAHVDDLSKIDSEYRTQISAILLHEQIRLEDLDVPGA